MARRNRDPRPARAYITLLQSDPELWGVQVTNLAVLVPHGESFLLDTSRHEHAANWTFRSEKKLLSWLRQERFLPTQDWKYWERPSSEIKRNPEDLPEKQKAAWQRYVVHVTWRDPAWDEKDGADIETEARSKSEACKYVRNQMRRDGHMGVLYFKATEAARGNPDGVCSICGDKPINVGRPLRCRKCFYLPVPRPVKGPRRAVLPDSKFGGNLGRSTLHLECGHWVDRNNGWLHGQKFANCEVCGVPR